MALVPKLPRVFYGGDYNPEQWSEEVWREDARLMREAGVNLVSVGIFSWAMLEPRPGEYDFAWLDRVMDLLHAYGVAVDLATATASPPPWLSRLHPETLPVTRDGTTLHPGARQHYCPSSPVFRERAAALARRMAERYGEHPALVMWHVGNEYAVHVAGCYCDVSAEDFRRWLGGRYGGIDALNEAWGTAFWSQRYGDWDEVLPPRSAPTHANPTQQLDFRRFSSDALLQCFGLERDALREVTPGVPITTNFLGFPKELDLWRWAGEEDIVSVDLYPDPADAEARLGAAMSGDLMRSLGRGRPWVLMEQTTARVNWRERNAPKEPGKMRLWSLGCVARGADGVMFFQWRQSRAGAEKFHSAMVPHGDPEETRSWREVMALGADLAKLQAVVGSRVDAEVGILLDWNSWWALELDSKPSTGVRQLDGITGFYRSLFRANVPVDFVHPEADLSRYRLLLAPHLYLVTDRGAENVNGFVRDGGVLVMSFFSGIVDENERVRLGGYPAPFREMLGLRVEDFVPFAGETNRLLARDGGSYPCDLWADLVHPEGAEVLATYAEGFYANAPAVTRHGYGEGVAFYLGTRPDAGYLDLLMRRARDEAGVGPGPDLPPGVEAVRRRNAAGTFLFLLNHGAEAAEVSLPAPRRDLLTGEEHRESLTLQPLEVAILEER